MLKDLFCESSLIIEYTLGNKIKAAILINIYAIRFGFIDEKFAKIVCKKHEILLQCLIRSKPIYRFDGGVVQLVIHAIYSTLSVKNYIKSLAPLFITKLRQYPIILGRP